MDTNYILKEIVPKHKKVFYLLERILYKEELYLIVNALACLPVTKIERNMSLIYDRIHLFSVYNADILITEEVKDGSIFREKLIKGLVYHNIYTKKYLDGIKFSKGMHFYCIASHELLQIQDKGYHMMVGFYSPVSKVHNSPTSVDLDNALSIIIVESNVHFTQYQGVYEGILFTDGRKLLKRDKNELEVLFASGIYLFSSDSILISCLASSKNHYGTSLDGIFHFTQIICYLIANLGYNTIIGFSNSEHPQYNSTGFKGDYDNIFKKYHFVYDDGYYYLNNGAIPPKKGFLRLDYFAEGIAIFGKDVRNIINEMYEG